MRLTGAAARRMTRLMCRAQVLAPTQPVIRMPNVRGRPARAPEDPGCHVPADAGCQQRVLHLMAGLKIRVAFTWVLAAERHTHRAVADTRLGAWSQNLVMGRTRTLMYGVQ